MGKDQGFLVSSTPTFIAPGSTVGSLFIKRMCEIQLYVIITDSVFFFIIFKKQVRSTALGTTKVRRSVCLLYRHIWYFLTSLAATLNDTTLKCQKKLKRFQIISLDLFIFLGADNHIWQYYVNKKFLKLPDLKSIETLLLWHSSLESDLPIVQVLKWKF